MLELLNSNYQPIKTQCKTFEDTFYNYLNTASEVKIASGYISEDSVADLLGLYNSGLSTNLVLIVGMHYFEGFTYGQYEALCSLAKILEQKKLGNIYLAESVKYHGKVYLFENTSGYDVSIIGSSNLTKIETSERIYDTDVLIDDQKFVRQIKDFLSLLQTKNCENINSIDRKNIKILQPDNLFSNYLSVKTVSSDVLADIKSNKTNISFEIPLKTEEKSNLNCYFGKPRKNFSNGSELPRHWYEAEVIVSKKITEKENYPYCKTFTVITDDGYEFRCKTSGDFSKNFRSADDLHILGKWIKGRMENARALLIGEKVTEATLKKYGRDTITLTKTKNPDIWYLDFGDNR